MADRIQVLCVDNESSLLEMEKVFLEQSGELSVDTVISAPAALDNLNKKNYDAIVSNYQMPEMDGIEFLKKVRAANKNIPFIIFTGRSREEIVIEALNNGATFYLQKAGDPDTLYKELIHVIRQAVQMRRTLTAFSEQEQRYHDLQNANDLIQSVAPDGHFLFVNKKWLDTLGYQEHELPNLTIFDVIDEESLKHCMEIFQRVISGENVGIIDAVFRTRDGMKVYVEGMADCKIVEGQPQYTRGIFKDVTDRRKAEEAQKESEETFRAMVEQSGEGIIIVDFSGMLQFANRRAGDIIEYPREKRMTGTLNVLEMVSPELRANAIRDFLQVSRGIDSYPVSYKIITFEKKEKWIECIGKKISYKGSPAMLLSFRDITERRKAEGVLNESEKKFRTIFENSPYPISINSLPDNKFIEVNAAFLHSSGYSEAEVLGKSPIELGLLSLLDYGKLMSRFLVSGRVENLPLVLKGKGGIQIHVQFSTIPFTINDQPAIMTMTAEVTKLKRVEESLRESEEKLALVMNGVPTLISYMDSELRFVYINKAHMEWYGRAEKDLIGKSLKDLLPKDVFLRVLPYYQQVLSGREVIFENPTRDKDGRERVLNVRLVPHVHGKQVVGIFAALEDITDRKNTEAAFQTMVRSMVGTTGLNSLHKITENVSSWLGAECVMVGEIQPDRKVVKVLSMLLDGKDIHDFSYTLKGTPCDNVAEKGFCLYADNVTQLFPESKDLVELNIRGYIGTPLRNSAGQVMGILCALFRSPVKTSPAVQEIMNIIAVKAAAEIERKRAEEALRESEERFRTIIHSMQFGIVIIDAQTHTILDANKKALEIIGGTSDIVLGSVCHRFICPAESSMCPVTDLKQTLDSSERVLLTLQGKKIPILKSVISTTLNGKEVLIESFVDITERKRAEESLRKSEERYRSFLEHVPELILVHQNGIILYTNPVALKTLGYTPSEALNRNIIDFIAPEYHERVLDVTRRRMNGEPVEPYEIVIFNRAGKRLTVIVNGSLIEFEGAPASLNVLVDITEQKVLRDAVTLANKKLNLLSSITRHDIINQLSALNGYLELSRDILGDPVKIEEYITKEQNIASTIETQILFTKDYQDMGIKKPEWQNVHKNVGMAIESLPLRGISVETDSPTLEVYADPLLGRVFYNLIDNALRYGGEQMTAIRFSSRESDRWLVIFCENDGVGIPADKKEAIFTRGYFKHTGFGLFLSREILSITGMTIAETGEPGKGARFEITVPKGAYRFTATGGK
jgi:PAS domain S-box-containing protein